MRFFKSKYRPYEEHIITKFAWLPIRIGWETRWLKKVRIKRYYWISDISGRMYWENVEFVD